MGGGGQSIARWFTRACVVSASSGLARIPAQISHWQVSKLLCSGGSGQGAVELVGQSLAWPSASGWDMAPGLSTTASTWE